jgi:hypothetical protein
LTTSSLTADSTLTFAAISLAPTSSETPLVLIVACTVTEPLLSVTSTWLTATPACAAMAVSSPLFNAIFSTALMES